MISSEFKQLLIKVFGENEGNRIYSQIINYLNANKLEVNPSNSIGQLLIDKQLMEESKERNDKLYEEYLNGNSDYKKLAEKYGITYDNVKKIIYRRNKKNRNN